MTHPNLGRDGHPRDPLAVVPPFNWEAARRRSTGALIASTTLTLAFTVAAPFMQDGDTRSGLAALAALLITVSAMVWFGGVYPWRRDSSATALFHRQGRLEIRASRSAYGALYAFCFIAGALCLLAPSIAGENPTASGRAARTLAALRPFFPYIAILPLIVLFSFTVRKRMQLGLGLSVEGVYHWGLFGCCFFPWDAITDVRTTPGSLRLILATEERRLRHPNKEENWVARLGLIRRNRHSVGIGSLGSHPVVPYYALYFYRRHPELRHELGSEAGLQRVREMNFPGLSEEVRRQGELRLTPRRTTDHI